MDTGLLVRLGKIAGIGGIALGVFFFIFNGILQKLSPVQPIETYLIIRSMMVFTFGIAACGLYAWLATRAAPRGRAIPPYIFITLAIMMMFVMVAAVVTTVLPVQQSNLVAQATPAAPPGPNRVPPPPINVCMGEGGGPNCLGAGVVSYDCDAYKAIGGGAPPTLVALNQRFCGAPGRFGNNECET